MMDTLIAELEFARTPQQRRAIEAAIGAMMADAFPDGMPPAHGPYDDTAQ